MRRRFMRYSTTLIIHLQIIHLQHLGGAAIIALRGDRDRGGHLQGRLSEVGGRIAARLPD